MSNTNIDIRLRPIRFAFLVRPDNPEKVFETFCINTCLWGGKFNPIIPVPQKVQNLSIKDKQTFSKYLDFYEPDFIVETEKNLSKGIDFDSQRILQIDNLLEKEGIEYFDNFGGYGQSVKGLYTELYKEKFKLLDDFEPTHIVYVKTNNENFKNFVSCVFGYFPQDEELQHFEKDYNYKFNPEFRDLSPRILCDFYTARILSPLKITTKNLKASYNQNQKTILFVLDFENTRDLIDLWNLRIVYKNVISIPAQWKQELPYFFINFIRKNYNFEKEKRELENFKKLSGIESAPIKTFSIFSNSISKEEKKEIEQIYKKCMQSFFEENLKIKTEIKIYWKKSNQKEEQ